MRTAGTELGDTGGESVDLCRDGVNSVGLTTGYPDGTFPPADAVSRQSMAVFLYRLSESPNGATPTCTTAPFPDVPIDEASMGAA